MASNIDNTSIDSTFPVAGQDNDSQGTISQPQRMKLKICRQILQN